MTTNIETLRPWERLASLVALGDRVGASAFMDALEALDTVRVVTRLDEEARVALLVLLTPEDAADVLEHMPDVQASETLEHMVPEDAARILEELPSDAQADLIGDLEEVEAEAILAQMEPSEARDLRELAAYPEDSAGGLMLTEMVQVPTGLTVDRVIDHFRDRAEEYSGYDVQYAYVVDEAESLVGVLRLRDLLLAPRNTKVEMLMLRDPHSVRVDAGIDELSHFFEEHHFFGAPVLDANGVLCGVLRRSGVEAAVAEQSDETFRRTQGIVGGEELRSMPLLLRSRRRLAWLSVNIVLNILAASIIALHQDTIEAVIALAVFLPIISDMSGCSGSQAVAVSLRELTLGTIRPSDLGRVFLGEVGLGVLNGLALGVLIGLVAWVWKGNAWLGLVVGSALALNTTLAVCVGGVIPLILKRAGKDPALASGPILTTITDMCGFFLVLSLAASALERLS
ncbi:MAG: magnesium transporter [Planctomycetota bacterium]|jgi:magnesium transporter